MADKPTGYSIVEGTIAQALGGSISSVFVLTLAAFNHYLPAGYESALGSLLSITLYLIWKGARMRRKGDNDPRT